MIVSSRQRNILMALAIIAFLIFAAQASIRTYIELERRVQDQWMRERVLEHQVYQTQAIEKLQVYQTQGLENLQAQIYESILTLNTTLEQLGTMQGQVMETKEVVDVIKREVKGEGPGGGTTEP